MLNEEMIEKAKEIANSIKIYSVGNETKVKLKDKIKKRIIEKEVKKNGN